MVLIDYYLPIAMDLADLQVFIISVDRYRIGQGCQLFIILHQDRLGRPMKVYYFPALLQDWLMVLIDYYLPIAMDRANLQGFIISIDRYSISWG